MSPPAQGPPAGSAPHPLLEPLLLGRLRLPNRIVFGAHITNFGRHHRFSERHRDYYAARAAGGAGLLVSEALTVHPLDYPYEHVPFGHREEIVPALEALAGYLRAAATAPPSGSGGAPPLLLAQLSHAGGQSNGRLLRQSPWAPSPVADVASKKMARAMDREQIAQVVGGFAETAARVSRAGWDGVELNAGQHALLRQFLSPLTNHRDDEYGGGLEQRMRLLLEVVAAVRAALGAEAVLGLKLCGDELAPWGGLTPADAGEIARAVLAGGGVDYFSVQIGGPYSAHVTDAGMPAEQGHAAHLAGAVREAIQARVPVLAEGRIETVDVAERILAAKQADAVVMTRALISDPELPRKLAAGATSSIRPHVGMNRYFVVQGDWNRPLSDLANPRAGREGRLGPAGSRAEGAPGSVLVIGGGPAGLEAAHACAAQRQHVRLIEAADRLGGMAARLAEELPARAEFGALVRYQEAALERLGVEVQRGRPVSGYEPWMGDYDRILVATGARPPETAVPAPGTIPVFTPRGLLHPSAGAPPLPAPAAGRAVVLDRELGFRMAATVDRLLAAGYGVDVVTGDFFVGRDLVESAEFFWFNRVAEQGAVFHPRCELAGQAPYATGSLAVRDRFSAAEHDLGPVALVVEAAPEVPENRLVAQLRPHHPRVVPIGDACAPRLMGEATAHAHQVAVGAI